MEHNAAITTPTKASWTEFRALCLRALAEEPPPFGQAHGVTRKFPEEFWRRRLRDAAEGVSWLVCARVDGQLAGMVGAFQTEDQQHARATVVGTDVAPEVRRKGIAHQLLVVLLDRLSIAERVAVVRLGVNSKQRAAVNLYVRAGFRIIGTETVARGDGCSHPVLVMKKPLP